MANAPQTSPSNPDYRGGLTPLSEIRVPCDLCGAQVRPANRWSLVTSAIHAADHCHYALRRLSLVCAKCIAVARVQGYVPQDLPSQHHQPARILPFRSPSQPKVSA